MVGPVKTTLLRVETIPDNLKAPRQWVVWRLETVKGKLTKPPYSVHTGGKASSTDPKTWATFVHALKRYEHGGYDGLGFVLSPDDPYTGIDLDHCRDPETGIIDEYALTIVEKINSYTEISPSGTGLHIFVRGVLPDGGRKKGNVEMYDAERYLTVTGDHLADTPAKIEERGEELADLHLEVFGISNAVSEVAAEQAKPTLDISDEELIAKAKAAKNGDKFARLWDGDTAGGPSQSEAEAALCSLLAFWTGRDPSRMDRLFRSSKLFREKWDSARGGSTYGADTIAFVLSKPGETYSPNGAGPANLRDPEEDEDEHLRRDEHLTDWGNAQRLVRLHGDQLRFCHAWGKWQIWDGRRWRTDDTGRVYRFAKSTVKTIYAEAKAATDGDVRKAIASWAMKSESQVRLEAMTISAQSEPGIPVRPEDLDADPWLFNVQNGTIDLRTGALRPHDPADLITKVGGVEFDAEAKATVFDTFLKKIMGDDDELIEYQQRTLGRSLTGDVSEHRIELWHGPGANGKSTLTTAILGVMGDYGLMAAPGLLLRRRQEAHPTEVADLKGARFVSSVEIGESRKLNEEQVKQLSGGDRLKARYMRQDFWEFDPTHKLFVACNHRPTIVGSDHAIWRRVRLVPFSVVIPDDEQDKQLGEKLKDERSGILNWLIQGCLGWLEHGVNEAEAVRDATADYRAEQDLVAAFVAECCTISPNAKVLSADIYRDYAAWCKNSHEEPLGKRAFGLRLGDQGFTSERKGHGGKHWWFGIGLSAQPTMDSDTNDD